MINIVTLEGFKIKPKDFVEMIHFDERLPWVENSNRSYNHLDLSRLKLSYLMDSWMDENDYSNFLEKYIKSTLDSCRKNQETFVISTLSELDFLVIRTIIKEDSKNRGGEIYCFGPDYDYKLNRYTIDVIDINRDGNFVSRCELFNNFHKYHIRLI